MAQDNSSATPKVTAQPEAVAIHEKYNFAGDQVCSIQVENILYKIHRYLLTRDSAVFRDMFDLPQVDPNTKHDDQVIYLPDSSQAFSTLCWALYALPTELMSQLKPGANIRHLMELARIANKYQFISLEAWSTEALGHHCENHNYLGACTYADACNLLSVARTCASNSLQKTVESGILNRSDIMRGSIPWKQFLPIFDEFGSWKFRGLMYYNLLQVVEGSGAKIDEETGEPLPLIPLSPEHIDCVRRGYWCTIRFWTCFAQDLLKADGCTDHEKCRQSWKTAISKKCKKNKDGQSIPQARILTKLARAEELVKSSKEITWNREVDVQDACLVLALKKVVEARERLTENMAVFFLRGDETRN